MMPGRFFAVEASQLQTVRYKAACSLEQKVTWALSCSACMRSRSNSRSRISYSPRIRRCSRASSVLQGTCAFLQYYFILTQS